ncbi:MAG: hypothetical protein LC790_03985 [Actinobacteria bacterium]|nr:hypothetical protein [Actinomycetota bacterium]
MRTESTPRAQRVREPHERPTRRLGRRALAGLGCATALVAWGASVAPSSAIVPGPDGQIAFESNRDGDNEIFAMNSDGTIERQLTYNKANDVFPAWSNDSSQITFSSDRAQAGNLDVYKMSADGSNVVRLTNAPGEDRGTSWTSDGQKIVFHSARFRDASHSFDIFVMNADGSAQQKIFDNGAAAYVCGDSINGRIVFNSNSNVLGTNPTRDFEIYTMDLAGGDLTQLTFNTVLDSGPKWSPDCSQVSYNSLDAGGSLDIFRIAADGSGTPTNLTNAPGIFDAFSAWSPSGDRIVFSSNRDVNFEIYSMSSVDGSDVTRLTFTRKGEGDLRPDWGTRADYNGPPTDKDQCKQGGWQEFMNPAFADQSQCVSYAQEGAA